MSKEAQVLLLTVLQEEEQQEELAMMKKVEAAVRLVEKSASRNL